MKSLLPSIFLTCALLLLCLGCNSNRNPVGTDSKPSASPAAATEPAFVLKNIGPSEAKTLIQQRGDDLTILDVRTPTEFATGHLPNAVNVNYAGDDFSGGLAAIDPSKDVLVHCAVGGRSTACLKDLEAAGFRKVFHLDGGMRGWMAVGNTVVKP